MSKAIEDMKKETEAEGYKAGTPEYDVAFRRKKLLYCQQMQNVSECTDCQHFTECELRISVWKDLKDGKNNAATPVRTIDLGDSRK